MPSTEDFIAEDDIFANAEGKVVEKKDAVTKVASKGARVSPADVEKYGLQKPASATAATLKGKLPEDFPGHASLEAAGLTTYAKVRKELAKDKPFDEVDGVGPATQEKIRAAMNESSEDEEEPELTNE